MHIGYFVFTVLSPVTLLLDQHGSSLSTYLLFVLQVCKLTLILFCTLIKVLDPKQDSFEYKLINRSYSEVNYFFVSGSWFALLLLDWYLYDHHFSFHHLNRFLFHFQIHYFRFLYHYRHFLCHCFHLCLF